MFATLNSIRSGLAEEYSQIMMPVAAPTALTIGFRYSRLYVPADSTLAAISDPGANTSRTGNVLSAIAENAPHVLEDLGLGAIGNMAMGRARQFFNRGAIPIIEDIGEGALELLPALA